jgi:hypothetical protein
MSETDPLKVMRMRLAPSTGWSRKEGSLPVAPPWPGALIGWPPHPVVWQIFEFVSWRWWQGRGLDADHFVHWHRAIGKCYGS